MGLIPGINKRALLFYENKNKQIKYIIMILYKSNRKNQISNKIHERIDKTNIMKKVTKLLGKFFFIYFK